MLEEILIKYLNDNLTVKASAEIPKDAPTSFVVIQRIGSSRTNKLDSATFAIQSYSDTLINTARLNEDVKRVMEAFSDLNSISACRFDRDYNFTDTQSKHYRYQSLFIITHY